MAKLCAIIGFFSPSNYVLPKKHLQTTITQLLAGNIDVAVLQVVQPENKPEPLPSNVKSGVWYSTHTLFWKENLWNLGLTLVPHEYLLFIDSDVVFLEESWPEKILEALDEYDLIQPFEIGTWLGQTGKIEMRRKAAAVALAAGIDPRPDTYHPGFAWAVTRTAINKMGGWYELHPAGGGDTATAMALTKQEHAERWANHLSCETHYWFRKSYQDYRKQATSLNLKIGYCTGMSLQHMWHGDRQNRKYIGRSLFLPQTGADEFPLRRRPDGLLEWTEEYHNVQAKAYFDQRKEDG